MTPFIKKKDIKKDWYLINANNIAVGRLAAFICTVLRGKNHSEKGTILFKEKYFPAEKLR